MQEDWLLFLYVLTLIRYYTKENETHSVLFLLESIKFTAQYTRAKKWCHFQINFMEELLCAVELVCKSASCKLLSLYVFGLCYYYDHG